MRAGDRKAIKDNAYLASLNQKIKTSEKEEELLLSQLKQIYRRQNMVLHEEGTYNETYINKRNSLNQ